MKGIIYLIFIVINFLNRKKKVDDLAGDKAKLEDKIKGLEKDITDTKKVLDDKTDEAK